MEIKWKQLKTIKGTAVNVPKFLEEILTSENERQALDDWLDIRKILVKNGEWVSSAAPVIRTLMAQFERAKFPEYIMFLIADIVAADCNDLWLTKRKTDTEANPLLKDCLDAISENISILFNSLNSNRRLERAGAAIVMGSTLGYGSWELKALENQYAVETDPLVKACLLCSLDLVDKSSRWSSEVQRIAQEGDPQPLVHGMATLCWLRSDANNSLDKVFQGAESWLITEPIYNECLPFQRVFHNVHLTRVLFESLNKQIESNRINVLKSLITLENKVTHETAISRLGAVIDLVLGRDPEDKPSVIPANELDEAHRLVAEGLADSYVYPNAGWMPAAGSRRRRWLGMDDPSILEIPVPQEVKSSQPHQSQPIWQFVQEREASRPQNQLLPAPLMNILQPKDRWLLAVEIYLHSYGQANEIDLTTLTECSHQLPIDDETVHSIYNFCRETLRRQQLVLGHGFGYSIISRLLLLPLARSNVAIPEEFFDLLWFYNSDEEREILASVPRDYLSRTLIELLKTKPKFAFNTAKKYLAFIDIAPTPELCDALIRMRSLMIPKEAEKYDTLLKEKAESVPELKRALEK
jgi:hypothetical protein